MLKFINNLNKSSSIRFINTLNKNNIYNIKINNTNLFNNNNRSLQITKNFTTKTTTTNIETSLQDSFNKYENNDTNNNNKEEGEIKQQQQQDLERRKELIRSVSENPKCSNTLMALYSDMNDKEMIPNPFYTIENRGDRAPISEFSKLDFAKLALSHDIYNIGALYYICNHLMEEGHHGVHLFGDNYYPSGELYMPLKKAAELLYTACDGDYNSISRFIISLIDSETYKMIDGTIISVVELALEGIKKNQQDFPFHCVFTYFMSKNHLIKLPKIQGHDEKEMNRMELLEISVESQKDQPIYLTYLFQQIGNLLENKKDTIKLFGDQIFTKQTAFAKGIELGEGSFELQLTLTNDLVKYMNVNDRVTINGVSLSRIDLLKRLEHYTSEYSPQDRYHLIESYKQLSKFYKQDGNIQESNRLEQLIEMESQNYKSYLIKSIEDTKETLANCCDYTEHCHLLATKFLKKDETISFRYEPSNKINRVDLARYAAVNEPLVTDHNVSFSKIMLEELCCTPTEDCHTALIQAFKASPLNSKAYHVLVDVVKINGKCDITPNSPGSYLQLMNILYLEELNGKDHFEKVEQLPSKSVILSKIYSKLIALEPEEPENYLQLGIHLKESCMNSISITFPICPISDKYFTLKDCRHELSAYNRKQIFCKYLELKFNTDSVDGILNSEPLAWYLLSLEMKDDNERLFGKSRKQILLNIIENIDSSYSQAYTGLSDLIEIDDDSEKIQLILKAIHLESDLNIKSIHLNKLANTLVDYNQKVELIDGRTFNKQQLLIESIEIYPRKNHESSLKLLIKTLVKSDDSVTLFGQSYDRYQLALLSDLIEADNDSKQTNYLDTFKIKSKKLFNKFKNYFKIY